MAVEIELREITKDNWIEAIKLKVKPEQENFVASNLFSLAQAKVEPYWVPLAVYAGSQMVGFVMYGYEAIGEEFDGWWVCRLMIDVSQQRKGYGKRAMEKAMELMRNSGAQAIYIAFEPENMGAEHLYRSLGFVDTGKFEGNERVFCWRAEK